MRKHLNDNNGGEWISKEMEGCEFRDERLAGRAEKLVEQLAKMVGASIPAACQDWANTKAAYRFLSNESVGEQEILSGHFEATKSRLKSVDGQVLVLHDTTSFSYQRDEDSGLGELNHFRSKRGDTIEEAATRGILMHSSLVITPEGLPLGLGSVRFWTRLEFKECNAQKRRINPTRVPIGEKESRRWLENLRQVTVLADDPERCVHIGDRESDIFEFFSTAAELRTHFLVRTCVDRLAEEDGETVASKMKSVPVQGLHCIRLMDHKDLERPAILKIKFREMAVHPPIGKRNQHPSLRLTVIEALEHGSSTDRPKIHWKLLTSLPVTSLASAIEKLEWYAQRWKIETFHKILKSGCRAEDSGLRTYQRLTNFIALSCIVGWRVFWMTMLKRVTGDVPPSTGFTAIEIDLLEKLQKRSASKFTKNKNISGYLLNLACLGGYLARANDPPPGNLVMWRGIRRLTDIQLGYLLAKETYG